MGKSKNKKHKPKLENPTGLPSVQDVAAEDRELASSESVIFSSMASLVEQVQSTRDEERECACTTIANLLAQPSAIPQLLKNNVLKITSPLVMDASWTVRRAALGTLRNLSVDGGAQVCGVMVKDDVLTPLVMLFKTGFGDISAEICAKEKDVRTDAMVQAVHLLWNLCENCETAVTVFNREGLVDILLPWLNVDLYGITLSLVVAQCLHTVTEDNSEISIKLGSDHNVSQLCTIIQTKHTSPAQLLFRSVAIGILLNVSEGQLLTAHGSILQHVTLVLGEILEANVHQMLVNHFETLETTEKCDNKMECLATNGEDNAECAANTATSGDNIECAANSATCEDNMECAANTVTCEDNMESVANNAICGDKTDTDANPTNFMKDIEHVVLGQKIALETITNVCCPSEEDNDWEDMNSSGESNDELSAMGEMEVENNSVIMSGLCVPAEVYSAFSNSDLLNKVLVKTSSVDETLAKQIETLKDGSKLMKSLTSLQCRGLLCIHNMISCTDQQNIGGLKMLQQVYSNVFNIATTERALNTLELLEAATSALRAIVQSMVQLDTKDIAFSPSEAQFVFEIGSQCSEAQVRANAVRLSATMGCILARQLVPANVELLKNFGLFLVEVASKDAELWVSAESLDAIFDVFAEDETDSIVKSIGLIDKLQPLVPVLKSKISQQRKTLGDHLAIVTTARTNLIRFIKYKTQRL